MPEIRLKLIHHTLSHDSKSLQIMHSHSQSTFSLSKVDATMLLTLSSLLKVHVGSGHQGGVSSKA